ncbi:hypothetical protein HMPREF0299_5742 [Corynebacterium matruchotii ATCC 14266]|uniref:Uncharacterized protein n=1 Tax=Corynebacterium matruchotii ATCC 14266 TaxID=553207 RepID=E0DBQ5_9CORY|nr:hypothetical protein HMPREF0299_5742 [Corynebacterium matruchotii ATCC 14266]
MEINICFDNLKFFIIYHMLLKFLQMIKGYSDDTFIAISHYS